MRRFGAVAAGLVAYTAAVVFAGWVLGGRGVAPAPVPADARVVAAQPARAEARAAPGPGRVCLRRPLWAQSPAAVATTRRLIDCQQRLLEATRELPTLRRGWRDDEQDVASEWTEALEAVFDRCPGDARLEVTDCAEYPCVALLRVDEAIEMSALRDQYDRCPVLNEWMSRQGASDPGDHVDFRAIEVRCPDGTTERVALFSAYDSDRIEGGGFDDINLVLGRRVESAAGLWACRGSDAETR